MKKEILKMRVFKELFLDYCPLCGTDLADMKRVTRWIHDIMNHREYFESLITLLTREQVLEILYEVIGTYYRGDNK